MKWLSWDLNPCMPAPGSEPVRVAVSGPVGPLAAEGQAGKGLLQALCVRCCPPRSTTEALSQ